MFTINKLKELDFYIKFPKTLIRILIIFLVKIYLAIVIKKIYISPQRYSLSLGTILIRQFRKKDLIPISNIFDKSFTYLSFDENRKYIHEIKKNADRYSTINVIAEYNEKCIGFITARPEVYLNKNHLEHSLHISWMAIDPGHRGYKISVKMLEYLIYIAKNMKIIEKIMTQTNVLNIPAIKAYEYLGFRKVGIIPEFMLKEDGIKLEKKLRIK